MASVSINNFKLSSSEFDSAVDDDDPSHFTPTSPAPASNPIKVETARRDQSQRIILSTLASIHPAVIALTTFCASRTFSPTDSVSSLSLALSFSSRL